MRHHLHACLIFILPRTGRIAPWVLRDGGQDLEWTAPSAIAVPDDVLGVVSLAVAGIGIAQSHDFRVAQHLESRPAP